MKHPGQKGGRTEHYDVVVVGGGASGMMAAGTAAARGKRVVIIEKNKKLGAKVAISGGGRCNITNAEEDERVLLSHYGKSEQFLYSAFAQFGMKDTFAFFEGKGLPLVVEARKRAFPSTQRSMDVIRVLERHMKAHNVVVKTGVQVTRLFSDEGKVTGVLAGGVVFTADSYVIATGGLSHPETGSTGDGFAFLETLGHTVVTPTPTIVPLAVKERWIKSLAGVSLSFMRITFFVEGKKAFAQKGKILFTHFGLSGPLILNSAKRVADLLHDGVVTAAIDCYPDTDIGALEKQVLKVFDANKNRMLKNVMGDIVPHGMSDAVLELVAESVPGDTKVHSVSKESRRRIVDVLKALPVTITGLMGYDRAVVADGGVPLEEIDTKTMRSKKVANLFVTGDLLHINRPSGGYSLQLCWTSGFVAGSHC